MRKFINENKDIFKRITTIEYKMLEYDDDLYHLGVSLKDLGKKCFGINKMEDTKYLDKIIEISKV